MHYHTTHSLKPKTLSIYIPVQRITARTPSNYHMTCGTGITWVEPRSDLWLTIDSHSLPSQASYGSYGLHLVSNLVKTDPVIGRLDFNSGKMGSQQSSLCLGVERHRLLAFKIPIYTEYIFLTTMPIAIHVVDLLPSQGTILQKTSMDNFWDKLSQNGWCLFWLIVTDAVCLMATHRGKH